ncbi:MAG: cysteine desulfurase family protein [Hyphomicrobiaceae bacterium]
MTTERVYMDYNATTPIRPVAREAVLAALDTLGNPSSVHREGRTARAIVEDAREKIAALVHCMPSDVVFTSGATEANNWVLSASWQTIFLPEIEHDSNLAPARRSPARVIELPAVQTGQADVTEVANVVLSGQSVGSAVLVLQAANNETGVVQPVAEAADFCREHDIAVHCDAVQAAGRIDLGFSQLGVDTLSLSSHKIGGPMGVGALIVRDADRAKPMIVGGGQERRQRAGTENVSGIAGFGAAAEAALRDLAQVGRLEALRTRLEQQIQATTPQAVIVGADAKRLANTSCVALPGTSAEILLIKLDLAGISVSSGAACSSGKVGASHVLSAMGLAPEVARGAIRISLGWNTSERDVDAVLSAWRDVVGDRQKAVA